MAAAPASPPPSSTLTAKDVRRSVARLKSACRALKPWIDPAPLLEGLKEGRVIAAAVAAAPPSPCGERLGRMLAGGLAGVRAYVHLGTEAAFLGVAGLDPFGTDGPLERRVAELAPDLRGEERILARHRALFEGDEGRALWCRAHAEAVEAEQGLLAAILRARGASAGPGSLFWFDPGIPPGDVEAGAALLAAAGRPPPPGVAAERAEVEALYREVERALAPSPRSNGAG